MAEVFRTDVVFSTNDELTAKLTSIVNALRGADSAAKAFQKTLNSFNIGRIGLPNLSVYREHGMAAGRAFSEGFASAAAAGMRAGMSAAAAAAGAAAGQAAGRAARAATGGAGAGSALVPVGNLAAVGYAAPGSAAGRAVGAYGALGYGGSGYNGGGGGGGPRLALPAPSGGGPPTINQSGRLVGGGSGGAGSGMTSLFARGAANNFGRGSGGGGSGGGRGGGFGMGGAAGMLGGGYLLGHAGHSVLEAQGDMIKDGMGYASAVTDLRLQGSTDAEMDASTAAAWKTSAAVPTSHVTENVKTIGELRYALGSTTHALAALTGVQQMSATLGEFSHGKIGAASSYNAARALEMSGRANTEEQFSKNMEMMTNSVITSGGKVTPEHFLGFAQQGGSQYTATLSDEFRYAVAPRLMQEMGGMRAGTGFAAINRQMIGGVAGKRTIAEMEKLGIVGPDATVGSGSQTHLKAGAVKDQALLTQDPYEWLQKYVAPKLLQMNRVQQTEQIARLFGTGPAQREAAVMLLQGRVLGGGDASPVERDRALYHTVQNGSFQQLMNASPDVQLKAFQAQVENFSTALGATMLPVIVPALRGMTEALTSMTAWVRNNPEAAQQIMRIAGAFGAAMVTIGALAIGIGTVAILFAMGTPLGALVLFTGALVGLLTYFGSGALKAKSFGEFITIVGTNMGIARSTVESALSGIIAAFHWLDQLPAFVGAAMRRMLDLAPRPGDPEGQASALNQSASALRRFLGLPQRPGDAGPDGIVHTPGGSAPAAAPEAGPVPTGGAQAPNTHHISYAPQLGGGARLTTVVLRVDGRDLARATVRHLADEIGGPSTGSHRYDNTINPLLPDMRRT